MNIRLSISAILLASLLPLAARAQSTTPSTAPDTQPSPLHFSWAALDHPSAIYHPTDPASLAIFVDNPTSSPQPLAGEILFGPSLPNDTFKPLSVTPISPATIAPGQRAKLPLALTFANVGPYELRFRPDPSAHSQPISHPRNLPLLCTFAPRTPPQPDPAHPSPPYPSWLLPLPREA
ncbi:MAG TPA: hypothetical protein VHQ47_15195, partial [Phycisphaerae bacterium]|nr:hypothetical protein [Phycisphaerae bacterium]